MTDLVPLHAFPNEPEAQVAAAALRDAGLHPVVLGHDPLAQLFDPARAARLLVPADEMAAAREVLGLIDAAAPPEPQAGGAALPIAGFAFSLLLIPYVVPRLLPLAAAVAFGVWLYVRRARRKAIDGMER